jgi:hypothetical protein
MIKLWNHTSYADEHLRALLALAGRRIGVKGDVAIKVTLSHSVCSSGEAHRGVPYLGFLRGKAYRKQLANVPFGWFAIRIGKPSAIAGREIEAARDFYETALHEMAHIKDFRAGTYIPTPQYGARRIAHDDRPCEKYAYWQVTRAKQTKEPTDLILALAVELERVGKE